MPNSDYPYQARSLMRFQAQDGQFTLNPDQIITVTGPTDDGLEWLNVTDQNGGSSSIPAGFLVPIQTESDPSPPIEKPTASNLPKPPPSNPAPHVSQASSQEHSESSTPSKAPPPPAAKPNALRDRIAMFNKPAPSPPPNTRPKPPMPRKPLNFPAPAPAIDASQEAAGPPPPEDENPGLTPQAGMSAADAEESVKASGSLKDRIRLLQQQQQNLAAGPEAPALPPKPKREWKRPAPPPGDEAALPIPIGLPPPVQLESAPAGEEPADRPTVAEPASNPDGPDGPVEEEDDKDEEEELARRRRIAERMARLGGSKMGFGLPLPAKPTGSPGPSNIAELLSTPPVESSGEDPSAPAPPERIVIPSIPKRALPPRRKAPSPANVLTPCDAPVQVEGGAEPLPSPDGQAPPSLEEPMPQPSTNDELQVPAPPEVPAHELSDVSPEDSGHLATLPRDPSPPQPEDLTPDADEVSEPPQRMAPSPASDPAPPSPAHSTIEEDQLPVPPQRQAPSPASDQLPAPPQRMAPSPASDPEPPSPGPFITEDDQLPVPPQRQAPSPASDHLPAPQRKAPSPANDLAPPSPEPLIIAEEQLPLPPQRQAPSPARNTMPSETEEPEEVVYSSDQGDPQLEESMPEEYPEVGEEVEVAADLHPPSLPPMEEEKTPEDPASEPSAQEQDGVGKGAGEAAEPEAAAEREEEDNLARRRRIAERMAKLGGAKIGFGFPVGPGLGGVRPTGAPKQPSTEAERSPAPPAPAGTDEVALAPAAPPTRKAPSPASIPAAVDSADEDGRGAESPTLASSELDHAPTDPPPPPCRPAPPVVSPNHSQASTHPPASSPLDHAAHPPQFVDQTPPVPSSHPAASPPHSPLA